MNAAKRKANRLAHKKRKPHYVVTGDRVIDDRERKRQGISKADILYVAEVDGEDGATE